MSMLDPKRFDHLSEAEVLRRIGDLVALMLTRDRVHQAEPKLPFSPVPVALIADPIERRIAEYLNRCGAVGAGGLADELGLPINQVRGALGRLRAKGLCERIGRTCGARYQLRRDYSDN